MLVEEMDHVNAGLQKDRLVVCVLIECLCVGVLY